MESIPPTT